MTDFKLTIEKVRPLLESFGFKEVERYNDFSRLDSERITIVIGYDRREQHNIFGVGTVGDWILLDDDSIVEVFNYKEPINDFSEFILNFIRNEGLGILSGDVKKMIELKNYFDKRSKVYTDSIMNSQSIILADHAWSRKDYSMFIKIIDQIQNIEELPASYKLKYKVATDRMDQTQ